MCLKLFFKGYFVNLNSDDECIIDDDCCDNVDSSIVNLAGYVVGGLDQQDFGIV